MTTQPASPDDFLAQGFVPLDAQVLAQRATIGHLPALDIPGQSAQGGFAPLADKDLGLYAVVDSAAWVQRVLDGGVRTVQLRIKDPGDPSLRAQVRDSVTASRAAGAQFFLNDHWQIAIEEGVYGVHLGQEDLATADLDAIARAGLRLGISTHAPWEVCRAWPLRPSYIACGPIHATAAKAMPWIPQGNANLAWWCKELAPLPVVAIGGMDVERTAQAASCGAAGVAVISAITAAASPEAAIRSLQQAVAQGRQRPPHPVPAMPRTSLQSALCQSAVPGVAS